MCAGWFAKDSSVLRRVGHVLLQLPYAVSRSPRQIVIADDCFQQVKIPVDRIVQVVTKSTEKLFGSMLFSLDFCSMLPVHGGPLFLKKILNDFFRTSI